MVHEIGDHSQRRGTMRALGEALNFIDNSGDGVDYQKWINIGFAINHSLDMGGFQLFDTWSQQSNKYNQKQNTSKTYHNLKPDGRRKAGSIFKEALDNGWDPDGDIIFDADVEAAVASVDLTGILGDGEIRLNGHAHDHGPTGAASGKADGHGQAGGAGGQQAGGATAGAAPGTAGPTGGHASQSTAGKTKSGAGQGTAGQGKAGAGPGTARKPSALAFDLNDWDAQAVFAGDAPPLEWLVQNSIPRGVAGMIASAGDVGKSYLCLELCLRVTCRKPGVTENVHPLLGGQIASYGAAVFITAEDGQGSVHRRLRVLDPDGKRQEGRKFPLYVIPLPDAGGLFPIISEERRKISKTAQLAALRQQLRAIPDLALVVLDPLQCFVNADINAAPQAAAMVLATLNEIAVETGATVLATHHVRKEREAPNNGQEARQLVRGSSALVDQSRFTIVLWPPSDSDVRDRCKLLRVDYAPNAIIYGAVVKFQTILLYV